MKKALPEGNRRVCQVDEHADRRSARIFENRPSTDFIGAKFSLGQLVQEAIRDLDEEIKGRNIDWKFPELPGCSATVP